MADIKLLCGLLLFVVGLVTSQDAGCGSSIIESHGKAIVFVQQLRPVIVRRLRHLAVEICPETKGNFYVQVWRNETTGTTPEFKLIWQYLVDREDPTQVPSPDIPGKALFTIPVELQLDLSGLTPSHINRLFFGVTAPSNVSQNLRGQIPVRSYFSLNSQSLVSNRDDDAGQFMLGEVRQFTELFYPYFFVLSLCEDGDVTKCELPIAPDTTPATCGIPGRVLSNITEIPFRGEVKAVMVDFCAIDTSLEVVILAPVQSPNATFTTYSVLWRQTIEQHGPIYKPTIVNITAGPTMGGADYHLVVRSVAAPSGGSGVIPVKEIFDPLTPHTQTHTEADVPSTLHNALHYPYFLPVAFCENTGCENPVEAWAREALGLGKGNLTTTVATPMLDIHNVTLIELPPLPGPPGEIGLPGPDGIKGDKGDMGVIGPRGPIGPQGPLGPAGYRGPRGETGFAGIPGAPAPVGPAGPPGEIGDAGEPGDDGLPGQRGDAGKPGLNNNSPVSPVAASATEGCTCSPLVSSMLVLGLIIWAVLLTLLVVLLLVVASKNVNASSQLQSTTQSIR